MRKHECFKREKLDLSKDSLIGENILNISKLLPSNIYNISFITCMRVCVCELPIYWNSGMQYECIYVFVHMYKYIHANIYMRVYAHICAYIHTTTHTQWHTHICVCEYVSLCMRISVCFYMYLTGCLIQLTFLYPNVESTLH